MCEALYTHPDSGIQIVLLALLNTSPYVNRSQVFSVIQVDRKVLFSWVRICTIITCVVYLAWAFRVWCRRLSLPIYCTEHSPNAVTFILVELLRWILPASWRHFIQSKVIGTLNAKQLENDPGTENVWRWSELVWTLSCISFNLELFSQTRGVSTGTIYAIYAMDPSMQTSSLDLSSKISSNNSLDIYLHCPLGRLMIFIQSVPLHLESFRCSFLLSAHFTQPWNMPYKPKNMWTPDHQSCVRVFPKLLQQSLSNVFVCCRKKIYVHWN